MATCDLCGNEEIEKPVLTYRVSNHYVRDGNTGEWRKARVDYTFGRYCWKKYNKACIKIMADAVKEKEELIQKGYI